MRKVKVLVLITAMDRGGAETMVINYLRNTSNTDKTLKRRHRQLYAVVSNSADGTESI